MCDVFGITLRHVTGDARVLLSLADGRLFAAGCRFVAVEAALSIEDCGQSGCRSRVRIMAGNAAEASIAVFEARALLHLLNMIYSFCGAIFGHFGTAVQNGPEVIKITSGAEVKFSETMADNACRAGNVTLVANTFAEVWREFGGVDNGVVRCRD
jgi:hypothetical protein